MKLWGIPLLLLSACVLSACGSGSSSLTVNLKATSDSVLTPYQASVGLAKVRVSIADEANGLNLNAFADLMPADKSARFDKLPDTIKSLRVSAEGFDEEGRTVAYARASGVALLGSTNIDVLFRRNLAYTTHMANAGEPMAAGAIYIFDVVTRTLAGTVRLPMDHAIGRGVSSKGGEAMLINFDVGNQGFLGILSAEDSSWTTVQLNQVQDLTIGVGGSNIVVSAGGTKVSLVDVDKKSVLKEFDLGGTVLAGAMSDDGKHAVIVADSDPGMVLVDLTDSCLGTLDKAHCIYSLMAVPQPGGVALTCDGHTAYITSRGTRAVAQLDLSNRQSRLVNSQGFPTAVGSAAYSCALKGVLATEIGPSGGPNVFTFGTAVRGSCPETNPCDGDPLGMENPVPTERNPVNIAADPSGHRLLVIEAGTSTESSGLTVIETAFQQVPVGSTGIYPKDPKDTVMNGENVEHRRYRPNKLGIMYGR